MEFILPNYRIPSGADGRTLRGATAIDMAAGTWSTTAGTNHSLSTTTVSPDARYSPTGVSDTFNTSYDPQLVYELPAAIASANDFSLGALVWLSPFNSTLNSFSQMNLLVYAGTDAGAGVYTNRLEANRNLIPGRWNYVQIGGVADSNISAVAHRTGWTTTGTVADTATIKRLRFYSPGLTGWAGQMFIPFGGLSYGGQSPKIVILSFDDGFASYATTVVPILQTYGIKVTHSLIAGNATLGVGSAGKMTWSQIEDISFSTTSWGNHTSTHPTSTTVSSYTVAQLQADIDACTTELVNRGLNDEYNSAYHLASPYGIDSMGSQREKYYEAAGASGMLSVRTVNHQIEGFGLADTRMLPCMFLDYTVTASRIDGIIRRLKNFIDGPGGVFRIGAHNIDDTDTTSNGYPVAEFTRLIKKLAAWRGAGEIIIMTEAEYQALPLSSLIAA